MKIININVDNDLIVKNVYDTESKVEKNDSNSLKIPTGNYKTIMLNFNFISPKFEEADLKIFASFNNDFLDKPVMAEVVSIVENGETYNHACYIPEELLKKEGKVKLGLFGYILNAETQELEKRYSLKPISSEVVLGSFQEDMVNAATPTPTVFEIYFQQVKDMADQVANDYELVKTAIESEKNKNIEDFNKKAEAKKTSLVSDFDKHATEKENEVKGNIDTHTTQKIAEFNENASSYDERITDNSLRVKRITNDLYDSGEASGNSINIKDSTLAEFQEISVDGVCKQETTTGKNLIDINEVKVPISSYKLPHTLSAGTYTISCKKVNSEMGFRLSNTTDTSTNSVVVAGTNVIENRQYLTLTTTFEANYINLSCTGIEKLEEIMLEPGDVPTNYEPYTGGQASPSPSYPQPIEVIDEGFEVVSCGKNFLSVDMFRENIIPSITNGLDITSDGISSTSFIEVDNTLPLKLILEGEFITKYVFFYDENYNYITNIIGINTSDISKATEYKDSKYIKIRIDGRKEHITKAHLEYNDGDIEYEPYQETRAPINLPDGEFVGKINETDKDQVRIAFNEEDGQSYVNLDKKIRRIVLDGITNKLSYYGLYGIDNAPLFYIDANIKKTLKYSELVVKSTHYTSYLIDSDNAEQMPNNNIRSASSSSRIYLRDDRFTSADEINAELSKNPVTVYYVSTEPYEVDLGVVEMPLSYSPETNVFTTSEPQPNINAKYYRNFINTIQNLQVNEKALREELIDINSRLSALETNLVNLANEEVESEVVE